jgi:hypothetical protein
VCYVVCSECCCKCRVVSCKVPVNVALFAARVLLGRLVAVSVPARVCVCVCVALFSGNKT